MARDFPNLFLVGAMRSGTTAFHELLRGHPDVFMSEVKEPAFFADPEELAIDSRVATEAGYVGDVDKYLALFPGAGEVRYRGESSTHYTKQPRINGVPERIQAASPDARILYLVRDPVERTLSHYRYEVRAKYERRRPMEALRSDPIYIAVSDYARQISPYLEAFGSDQVLVVALEDLAISGDTSRNAVIDAVFRWLDLDPEARADRQLPRRNQVTGKIDRARGPELLHRLGRSSGYQRLASLALPTPLRSGVRWLLNREIDPTSIGSPEVIDFLRSVHLIHAEALEDVLGRSFDNWTTLRPQPG